MRELLILAIHLLVTFAKLARRSRSRLPLDWEFAADKIAGAVITDKPL